MARLYAEGNTQEFAYDGGDAGEGLAIFLGENFDSTARYEFLVEAITDQGKLQVGRFSTSPPGATTPAGSPTRMVAGAVCPGAKGWAVSVTPTNKQDQTAELILASSRCCTSPIGVSRVAERYIYISGPSAISTVYNVLPGQKILSWSALATADGSVALGTGSPIVVPAGASVSGEPMSGLLMIESFTFVNCDWFIELLESA